MRDLSRDRRGHAEFVFPWPLPLGNIMQGSVAEHLDNSIDAEIRLERQRKNDRQAAAGHHDSASE